MSYYLLKIPEHHPMCCCAPCSWAVHPHISIWCPPAHQFHARIIKPRLPLAHHDTLDLATISTGVSRERDLDTISVSASRILGPRHNLHRRIAHAVLDSPWQLSNLPQVLVRVLYRHGIAIAHLPPINQPVNQLRVLNGHGISVAHLSSHEVRGERGPRGAGQKTLIPWQ